MKRVLFLTYSFLIFLLCSKLGSTGQANSPKSLQSIIVQKVSVTLYQNHIQDEDPMAGILNEVNSWDLPSELLTKIKIATFEYLATKLASVSILSRESPGTVRFWVSPEGILHSFPNRKFETPWNEKKVMSVTGGFAHVLALTEDGKIYSWGCELDWKLGYLVNLGWWNLFQSDWQTWGPNWQMMNHDVINPRLVTGPWGDQKITGIAAGPFQSAALTADGELYMWGNNGQGLLGQGKEGGAFPPQRVMGRLQREKVISISNNFEVTTAITQDGKLYTWGDNSHYQIGTGDEPIPFYLRRNAHLSSPYLVRGSLEKEKVRLVLQKNEANHGGLVKALTESGRVYSWGDYDSVESSKIHTSPSLIHEDEDSFLKEWISRYPVHLPRDLEKASMETVILPAS